MQLLRPSSPTRFAVVTLLAFTLTGCADRHLQSSNVIGGVMVGAAAGGAIGAVCCANPVHGIPAGILIGGIAGGTAGFFKPTRYPMQ